MVETPKSEPVATLGNAAQRKIARLSRDGPVPPDQQLNYITRELGDFLTIWCDSTGKWMERNRSALEKTKGDGGKPLKENLIHMVNMAATALQQLLKPLYQDQDK